MIGFTRARAHDLLGWSELPWASSFACLACHLSHVVDEARSRWGGQDVCELPDVTRPRSAPRQPSLPMAQHARKRAQPLRDTEGPEHSTDATASPIASPTSAPVAAPELSSTVSATSEPTTVFAAAESAASLSALLAPSEPTAVSSAESSTEPTATTSAASEPTAAVPTTAVRRPAQVGDGMSTFLDGRWACFAHYVQTGRCVADVPASLCSQDSNLSLAECVRRCDSMPSCQMAVHNQPSHLGWHVRGCWLKARIKVMRRDSTSFNTHTCVQLHRDEHASSVVVRNPMCTNKVVPVDVPPVRSAQVLHDVLARELASSSVLEIGARNGDSIECFARAARAASVIEAAPSYCNTLQDRARRLHEQKLPDFAVECGYFPQACSTQPLLCSHVNVFIFWMAGGRRHATIFARDTEHPLLNSDVAFEAAVLHAHGRTHKDAKVIVIMDISMRGHMHDLRAVARRGWSDWMAFVPFDERAQCLSAARREDGGGLRPYGGEAVCGRARGAMMAVAIPLGRMVQQGEPIHWHKPPRDFTFRLLGLGCCRMTPGHETSKFRASLLGPMFASDCASACEVDGRCAAFELVGLEGRCRITPTHKPRHTCRAHCWLFLDVVGLPLATECDRETGAQVCYAKQFLNASAATAQRATQEGARSSSDVKMVGGKSYKREMDLERPPAFDQNDTAPMDVASVARGAACSTGGNGAWSAGAPALNKDIEND